MGVGEEGRREKGGEEAQRGWGKEEVEEEGEGGGKRGLGRRGGSE